MNKFTMPEVKRHQKKIPFASLHFSAVNKLANSFANHIEANFDVIADILLDYESFEVVQDEIARALDLMRNLHENKKYFAVRIGEVTSFLPRNQPLYALACFVIVPSLMASEVHFRIPHSMQNFFPKLLKALNFTVFFPNVIVSNAGRLEFLKERSALRINPKTEDSIPITDAVVFTGTPHHADRLRLIFDQRTLFIANGSGHNPLVLTEDGDISKAVEATLNLQLYNQGQDCAAPNAILVHRNTYEAFIDLLRERIKKVKVGCYRDRSCRVGPISDPEDLKRIQMLLIDNRKWLDPTTPGNINSHDAIVEPTIICRPLKEGGNFTEVFAPIIIVQKYDDDADLCLYFEHPSYARNAMYISLFGNSHFIETFIRKSIDGKKLHSKSSVLLNTHLHAPGVERGTQPYGGYGYAASSLSINGKIVSKPTLPQRDIYDHIAKYLLGTGKVKQRKNALRLMGKIVTKNVNKLMGLKMIEKNMVSQNTSGKIYLDSLDIIATDKQRYIEFGSKHMFVLLDYPNVEHIANMQPKHIHQVRTLRKFLERKHQIDVDDMTRFLYSVVKKREARGGAERVEQLTFFQNVYQLLLGKNVGPRLAHFLIDADRAHIVTLLDV
ncbi:aldehyde dehydrogenase family protein [Candidatus Uhrbacteria bacterium]|nr:aldehyde dehydrogenase family protein [Candidatus Uhrbacteria bacterium]